MGRQWRQRPIACQSCRQRKIRCSRQFPCSNCTSRGLRCVQFYEPLAPVGPEPEEEVKDENKSVDVTNSDIQSRLDRLETWITGLAGPAAGGPAAGGPSVEKIDARPTSRHAQPLSPPLSSTVQHLSEDALWFGGNFLCKKVKCIQPDTSFLDVGISYNLSPIRLIKRPYSIVQDASSAAAGLATRGREMCLTLPLYHEACLIVHTFIAECAVVIPIVHVPSLLLSIQSIYASIQQQTKVDTQDLLLFMSIIASVTYACSPEDDVCKLFPSYVAANTQCGNWISASFALSDELKRRGQTGIVCLQGQNILFKVCSYIEGSSVRTRSLISTSISMARDMGLHRIDLPGNKADSLGLSSEMEVEIARRLWWDLVVIDWLFAFFPGPQEGVYTIHPRHMAVNKPSVIKENTPDGTLSPQEIQQQSDVTYLLERIRIAEIGRAYIDRCPLSQANTDAGYQERLQHDTRLEQYQQELPPLFSIHKLCDKSASKSYDNPSILVQLLQINCLVYVERCILHLQFLALSTIDPKYAPSRKTCFTCASEIVRLHKQVQVEFPWILPRLKATTYLRTLILASAVFLLDVCSGTDIRDLQSERPDMLDAWKLMSDMQEDSNLIEQFFEFAAQMLRKYGVSETTVADLARQRGGNLETGGFVEQLQHVADLTGDQGKQHMDVELMDMDQRWQTLDADFDLKTMSWDNVLWGFDAILM